MSLDWRATLATVAPVLASALSGPLAGTALGAIATALGFSKGLSEQKLIEEAVLQASPTTLTQLRAADADFQLAMAELKIDLETLENADRANARQRQVETKDQTPALMGGAILAGFFLAFAAMLLIQFPEGSKEALFILLGVLGGMASSVTAYYFGSTTGSAAKTRLLSAKRATDP